MRLIHCSDLHLDAALSARYDTEKASQRRRELLNTFARLMDWAQKHGTDGILLCGDLFDTSHPSRQTIRAVEDLILTHDRITVFYLRGNHDMGDLLFSDRPDPPNLCRFDQTWTKYALRADSTPSDGRRVQRDVFVCGAENTSRLCPPPTAASDINIVMLHGQVQETDVPSGPDCIPMRLLCGRHIDYLALGHIHSYRLWKPDVRCTAAYCGTLEGHGFDECGDCGFILLDIDEQTGGIRHRFIPFAARRLFTLTCDVTACTSVIGVEEKIRKTIRAAQLSDKESVRSDDLVRIELTGSPDYDCSHDLTYLSESFADQFYYVTFSDSTRPMLHTEDYLSDPTLKGEFVRAVLGADDLSQKDKEDILRCGLMALSGETIEVET